MCGQPGDEAGRVGAFLEVKADDTVALGQAAGRRRDKLVPRAAVAHTRESHTCRRLIGPRRPPCVVFRQPAHRRANMKSELGTMSARATTVSANRKRPCGGSKVPVATSTSRPSILPAAAKSMVPRRNHVEA